MIGLDTNVLVRYLAQDDAKQSASATQLIENRLSDRSPGFISLIVLVELCWVLERLYGATRAEIGQTVEDLLATPTFHVQQREAVREAALKLTAKKAGKAGFADLLIAQIALDAGCTSVFSFDKGAVRHAGMSLLA